MRSAESLPRGGVNLASASLRSRSPHAFGAIQSDYCEQGIDHAAQHGPERRVAFNAVRLPIRRIVGQYGDVARVALFVRQTLGFFGQRGFLPAELAYQRETDAAIAGGDVVEDEAGKA